MESFTTYIFRSIYLQLLNLKANTETLSVHWKIYKKELECAGFDTNISK